MTGIAFNSCDERFDNPVSKQQDPTNPNATWSYEVNVKFASFETYNDGEKTYKFEAPNALFVYNQNYDLLGTITCAEGIDQNNYTANSYKFAGSLKGAIGETLFISTADINWFADQQDGTLESILKNGIMQSALVPIIVTNETTGKIGTKSVTLENNTAVLGFSMSYYATGKETGVTITNTDFYLPYDDINITFAKDVKPDEQVWVALPLAKEMRSDYHFQTTNEKGVDIFMDYDGLIYKPGRYVLAYGLPMLPKVIDLKEVADELGAPWVNVYVDGATIIQSSKDPVSVRLYIYAKDVTIKDLNLENSPIYIYAPTGTTEAVLNIEGENVVNCPWYSSALSVNRTVTLKGNGSISLTGYDYGIRIYGWRQYIIDDNTTAALPASLTIEKGVTVKAKGDYGDGIYINKQFGIYNYKEDGKWLQGEFSETFNNFLKVDGTLEVESDYQAIWKIGIMTIGETGIVKATSNNANVKIWDANASGDDHEAKLETLVADKSKFSDEISEDKKVRTIKKK